MRRLIVLPAIAAATLTATGVATLPNVNEQDRAFLTAMHQGNLAEIQAGRAAEQQAQTKKVQRMGSMLVQDHKKLDKEVQKVARQVRVALPGSPSKQQQAELQRITAKRGAEFDRAWVEMQIAAHRKDLAAGRKELSDGSSEKVKQLFRNARPIIKAHLNNLERIQGD